jgi:hypothetical protein
MSFEPFSNFEETHAHEENLRTESMQLARNDKEIERRLLVVEKAMALIFGFTVDHNAVNDDERTMQMLGVRLFNAAASAIKLGLSGYYQTALQQARDILELGFLLDYFRTSPEEIAIWRTWDRKTRRLRFDPVKIRIALDERDGTTDRGREREYNKLSELASHATYRGFALTTREGRGELGPFVDKRNLLALAHEMVLRLGPAAVMYANQFSRPPEALAQFLREFGTELVMGFKNDESPSSEALD